MPPSHIEVEIIGPDGVPVGVVRRPPPPIRNLALHVGLFLLTALTTTVVGGLTAAETPVQIELPPPHAVAARPWTLLLAFLSPALLRAGLAFSLPLLAILLAHEMGHYLACRAHRLDASLPYFIPVPFGIGTLGAFIRIRSPLASKRELLDVGAAGPLAGFAVALPMLVLGVALSRPVAELPRGGYIEFGEPLILRLLASQLHPDVPPGGDILLHPVGFAAWFGIFATALNLLPFGQLDGGHVTYALFGRAQRRAAWPLLLLLVALGLFWTGWLVWAVVALVMGVRHPWMPDEDVPLDPRRRVLGWLCLAVFVLCFTPEPIRLVP